MNTETTASTNASSPASSPAWFKAGAILGLVLGLGLGLLTLGSVAGIWLGLWDFRRAFALLGMANKYGAIVAWICVGISMLLLILGSVKGIKGSARLISASVLGAVIAWAAYLVPESYRPPEGVSYPPIHDISTDRQTPPAFVAVVPLRTDAPNPVIYGTSEGMTPEKLAQTTQEAYPDLVPRRYETSTKDIFDRALAAVHELGWELVDSDEATGRIEATATTLWFRFKDDVVIRVASTESGSVVDARSTSRVGRGDVGANATRLRAFFAILDR